VQVTSTRRPTGFGGADPPPRWPLRPSRLDDAVDTLPGVGVTLSRKLAKLGIVTLRDLLEHRPFRYEEPAPQRLIAEVWGEDEAVLDVEVQTVRTRPGRGRLKITTARVADASGAIDVTFFNQPWLADKLTPGTRLRVRGRRGRYGFEPKSYDIGGDGSATADFAPVYPATEDVTAKRLRDLVTLALAHVREWHDPLPAALLARDGLPPLRDALVALHRPRSLGEAEAARQRLAFDELLVLQLGIARRAAEREVLTAPALGEPGELIDRYRAALPFTFTEAQEAALAEIDRDLRQPVPMQRLLQGDVGSGKTVVALYALLRAVEAGYQGALMAPTETLAEQHFLTIAEICLRLGVTCSLLTSSVPKRERNAGADVVIGTHALIQHDVRLERLAVAVVDEQHRFGVEQRRALVEGRSPHALHMTATPIPRTLALTVYGDLSVSEIAKPPANRKPIVTAWVTQDRESDAYRRLRAHLEEGRQAYVVCPLIEESETSSARAAEQEAERLRGGELRGLRVGCLHGRLKPAERRELMRAFNARDLDVLVATTVIEVGVDVPNATIMIVQEADRFGLAQLHQLRGRVGRGGEQSYCLLVSRAKEELSEDARTRLEAMVETTDGFALAEVDLDLRGEGQLLGKRQSGLTDLKFAHIRRDRELLERARTVARELVGDPDVLRDEIARRFAALDPDALA
jgi:ATP-dependent DNA helicase RecG